MDYADPTSAGNLMPPGNTEEPGEGGPSTASVEMWLDSTLKPTFPDPESTADWAISEELLIYGGG